MATAYDSSAIEVLSGLEPVRKRPGMYTDTTRPNHLAQEVIDNAVDEALAGHASKVAVTLGSDGSLEVVDDGRGMPVDQHPRLNKPGVEVILTTLHSGGKFSEGHYRFSGGLHGVGVSVVNALSRHLEVAVRRGGREYRMTFAGGEKKGELEPIGSVGKRNTGTRLRFLPDAKYFDSVKFNKAHLRRLLRAKAVLCPGLTVTWLDEAADEREQWRFDDGMPDYLMQGVGDVPTLPEKPFTGHMTGEHEAADWAVVWLPEGGDHFGESYVNLVPTPAGGAHVNGMRSGLTEALREFADRRGLLPRGVKITADDVAEHASYVLSVKLADPQFAGQTKEKLASRSCQAFVSGVVSDHFAQWLNRHPQSGDALAQLAVSAAQQRQQKARKVPRKKVASGPALPGKLADCTSQDVSRTELFLVEGDSAGGSAKQARDREFQAVMPLRGKIMNTWDVKPEEVFSSQEVHDITVALGVDPGNADLSKLRYNKLCILADADSDGAHIATLLCALFVRHFRPLVAAGHVYVAMPPLYRIDIGKNVYYAIDDEEKEGVLERITAEKQKGKPQVTRFKGLGEMDPLQLRETTMAPDTRRLVQLTIADGDDTNKLLDMLLAKKRVADRRKWLEERGNLAEILG
ncbi:MAG: DNA topoisomerase IV subunit B [Halofilum sp. (in: g-proteobacteria)]|nr:DNA topoisomerase IV subunit B [Halofilum sp. (in: g-proteobacteria)]